MKNIIEKIRKESDFTPNSIKSIYRNDKKNKIGYWLLGLFLFLLIVLFLPWTQNISSSGHVTTLYQDQRPQQINTVIPGKIIKWYIKEGDIVKKGDTIVQLADTKDDYLDSNLVERTKDQLTSKEQKLVFYNEIIKAIETLPTSPEKHFAFFRILKKANTISEANNPINTSEGIIE